MVTEVDGLDTIRLLYLYPKEIRPRLIEEMASNPKIACYFDLSLQHASQTLLRAMKRPGGAERYLESDRFDQVGRTGSGAAIELHRRVSGRDRRPGRGAGRVSRSWPNSTGPGSFPTRPRRARRRRSSVVGSSRTRFRLDSATSRGSRRTSLPPAIFPRSDRFGGSWSTRSKMGFWLVAPIARLRKSTGSSPSIKGEPGQWLEVEIVSALGPDLEAVAR